MASTYSVIKVGGAVLDHPNALANLLTALAETRTPFVLVHGGGSQTDHMLKQAGYQSEKINGQRVTPQAHMDIVTGALAGTVNKRIVGIAQRAGFKAVGLSLADGPLLYMQRNHQLGCVGEPSIDNQDGIGATLLTLLLAQGFLPVVSSIGVDQTGQLLNVNADYAAAALANVLGARLILLSDVSAILDASGKPLNVLAFSEAQRLLQQDFILGGMKVKLAAALLAAERSRRITAIAGWAQPESVIALLHGEYRGTCILPAK